jgi:hypothetical protein
MSQDTIRHAMQYALEHMLDGVKALQTSETRWMTEFSACGAKPFDDSAFNAEYRTVDFTELTTISSITENVHIVDFQGTKYVHKATRQGSLQSNFEKEFRHYIQLESCEGVPSLVAIVKRNGMIRGLLISFIDGEDLYKWVITSAAGEDLDKAISAAALLAITYQIISIAAGLEKVGYYNEDLKCQNIVRRRSDGAIYFIDFAGGLTEGFFPKKSWFKLCCGDVAPKDGIYILGKTLWQLWTMGVPNNELPDSIPEPARSIIHDCCVACKFTSIQELRRSWCLED